MSVSKDTWDRLIDATKLVALICAGVGAHALGASDLAMIIVAGALGNAMPGRVRTSSVAAIGLALTFGAASMGCTGADYAAFKDSMRPVVEVGCSVARKIVQGCPFAEAVVGATSGGDSGGFLPEPEVEDIEP